VLRHRRWSVYCCWCSIPCRLGNEGLTTPENVRDLGVVADSHSPFSEHTVNITCKAHQRANLIQRCFSSRNRDMLGKAIIVYVCQILEFSSPVWSPSLMNIFLIESVQIKFTKRIPGMSGLNCYSRFRMLRSRTSSVKKTSYWCVAGLQNLVWQGRLNSDEFFTLRNQPHLHGHKCVMQKQRLL